MEKARDKYKLIQNQKDFETLVSKVKTYIADRQWSEAKEIIKELQDKYPEKNDIIRNLYKQIFDAEEAWNDKLSDKKHTFSPKVEQSQRECHPPLRKDKQTKDSSFDDFFGNETSKGAGKNTGKVPSSNGHNQPESPSGDSFFDSDTTNSKKTHRNQSKKQPLDDFFND